MLRNLSKKESNKELENKCIPKLDIIILAYPSMIINLKIIFHNNNSTLNIYR